MRFYTFFCDLARFSVIFGGFGQCVSILAYLLDCSRFWNDFYNFARFSMFFLAFFHNFVRFLWFWSILKGIQYGFRRLVWVPGFIFGDLFWWFALRRLKAAWGFRIEAFCYILYFRCVSLSSAYWINKNIFFRLGICFGGLGIGDWGITKSGLGIGDWGFAH